MITSQQSQQLIIMMTMMIYHDLLGRPER